MILAVVAIYGSEKPACITSSPATTTPNGGRFINADSQLATGDFTGLNLFAYCGNNPVNRTDPTGDAWWHWAVAAAVVAAAAVAVVVTAGGAAAAITAVTLVANGVAASTTAATVAAGVFIGSATAFAGSAYIAAISSNSAEEFASYGGSALVNTTIGGFLGGTSAYNAARTSNQSMQHAGESACFIAGTLIRTDNGSVPIEQIAVGDLVWAWDEDTGQIELKPVVETYINEADELIHIFVNGEEIITTSEHPFYSPVKGWTEAALLRTGDILVLVNGEYVVVEQIHHEILETPTAVYNFQVKDDHTYFVGFAGILVHNACKPSSPVKVSDKALKGIDVHAFKKEFVGTNISSWDVFKDTANESVLWLGNKAQTAWIETGYFLEELLKLYPK